MSQSCSNIYKMMNAGRKVTVRYECFHLFDSRWSPKIFFLRLIYSLQGLDTKFLLSATSNSIMFYQYSIDHVW